ncbi:MAG TPA: tetratricopeptide repeat protein, partial [Acidimicrobiales bacterium]|nr:tetratricopeptide repeat protein [Acidimicrobiales bacterium]
EGCRDLFRLRAGPAAPFRPGYLEPTGPVQVVTRVLANLRHSYALAGDHEGVVRAQSLVVLLPGAPSSERRQLARALLSAGRVTEAAEELERLAEHEPGDAEGIRRSAAELRARLN